MKPLIYLRTNQPKKNGLCTIYMRITIKSETKHYSLKISIHPDSWDAEKSKVTRKEIRYELYNKLIAKHLNKAENIIFKYTISDNELTLSEFDKNFTNKLFDNIDFFVFVESELETRVKKSETMRTYKSQLTKLKQFRKELTFSDLRVELISEYKNYMIEVLKNKPNTYHKSLSMLKTFTNWAIEKNHIEKNPFKEVKTSKEPGKRDFLNVEEVRRLEKFYHSEEITPGVKNVLRSFLFTCYTGLRYTDVKNLKFSDLKDGMYENAKFKIISIQMHKTGLPVNIPIIPKAEAYMPKMISEHQKIFDVKTGTTIRKRLTTAAKITGIKKHLTFHVARYTVGTIGLENGIAIETISDILGHTNIMITKRLYAKTDNNFKYKELLKMQ